MKNNILRRGHSPPPDTRCRMNTQLCAPSETIRLGGVTPEEHLLRIVTVAVSVYHQNEKINCSADGHIHC